MDRLAVAALGWRSEHRSHALPSYSLPSLLAAPVFGGVRSFGYRSRRTLRQLGRPTPDKRGHSPARHLLLGFLCLFDRRSCVSHHRPAGPNVDISYWAWLPTRALGLGRDHWRRGGRDALYLALSRNLSPTLAHPFPQAARPLSAMAMAFHFGVHRRAWDRFARRSACHSLHDGRWTAISPPRHYP